MRLVQIAFSVVALVSVTGSALGWCDPNTDYSVKEEFGRSAYVAVVQVTQSSLIDEHGRARPPRSDLQFGSHPGFRDAYNGVYYRANVEKLFKGQTVRFLSIWSENTEARTPLAIGERYLVFLYRLDASDEYGKTGDLTIDYCGNSTKVEKAGPLIDQLERLRGGRE